MRHVNLLVHLTCLLVIALGYTITPLILRPHVLAAGYFGFSGALTNWLAVHMLFEKIPFVYGSGIVPMKFEAFKTSIFNVVMGQFFTLENIRKFAQEKAIEKIDLDAMIDQVDTDFLFDGLVRALTANKMGNLMSLLGGRHLFDSLREPFAKIIRKRLLDLTRSDAFRQALNQHASVHLNEQLLDRVTDVVHHRLDELTPDMVKQIVQNMIRSHLGWLVVWGGVFGGLIGLGTSFVA